MTCRATTFTHATITIVSFRAVTCTATTFTTVSFKNVTFRVVNFTTTTFTLSIAIVICNCQSCDLYSYNVYNRNYYKCNYRSCDFYCYNFYNCQYNNHIFQICDFYFYIVYNCNIVKRVSWFRSSLLLRINNKHTYKY